MDRETQTMAELVEDVHDVLDIVWSRGDSDYPHWAHRILKEMIEDVEKIVGRELPDAKACLNDVDHALQLPSILRDALTQPTQIW